MNKDIAFAWAERLESGLPQTTGSLTKIDADGNVTGHCCLGVLCELAVEAEVIEPGQVGYDHARLFYGLDQNSACTPEAVVAWAGLRDDLGWISTDGTSLASMNDNGVSFREIARAVREHWEVL